ncbi:MAG: signal peptide peptidase SppA [Burkholderiaceae bacterium]|nr:signal peptide peptidase SppA [Burkholderiaceae bacterium]
MDQEVVEKVLLAHVQEQRRARRWGNFWRFITFAFVLGAFWFSSMGGGTHMVASPTMRHTAMIDLHGVIDFGSPASAELVSDSLREAFKNSHAAGIILRINSPGGSPVQSGIVFDEIRRLKAEHKDKPVIAVVEDVAASGGYYIASAADFIYVNQASLVGSIGVRMDSFGFTEALKKLGVERRVLTAGENKAMLDPFLPMDPKQRAAVQSMINDVHGQFIAAVKQGRGDRLKPIPELFSGMVWTGAKSIELGLADGLGTVDSVARDVIKAEEVIDYTLQPNFAERLAKRFGAAAGDAMFSAMMRWSVY